jgi:hypothetical protein
MIDKVDAFDWVTARSKCSTSAVFERLKLQINEDVEKRNALIGGPPSPYIFRVISNGPIVTVLLEGHRLRASVMFRLQNEFISVSDDNDNLLFHAAVTLNDEGRCVVKINDEDRELWQMRKMALEKLFFAVAIRGGNFFDSNA